MAVWHDVQIANRNMVQVEFELNRKLRQLFGNINPNQITGGLPDFTGVLPLTKGGTGQNLSTPLFDAMLFYDTLAGGVSWLYPGDSVKITSGVIDTIQDIRTTASPTFSTITANDSVQIGTPGNDYVDVDYLGITVYDNNIATDYIPFVSLGSIATNRTQLDITGIIQPNTTLNTLFSGPDYTMSGDSVYLGVDSSTFNSNINLVILHNGVELIKNSDVVYVTDFSFIFPSTTLDIGDVIIIKG